MTGNFEALGDMVNAGLLADAIDHPAAGPAGQDDCANCGTPLRGSFCSNCGQKAHLYRSLADVGHEFLHGITHFDGKAWSTLPMLLFRPGKLTREYIMGKRARYIAPVPLFLLVVFLMFFVFSFVKINPGGGATTDSGKPMTRAEAIAELPRVEAELRDLDRQIAAATASGDTTELPGLKGARMGVAAARDAVKARARNEVNNPLDLPGAIAAELGSDKKGDDWDVNLGNQTLNQKARAALNNPGLMFYKIQSKAYKLSFLLVPLSLPWLWLMFAWKREVRLYDHAVFALYSLSFMSLLFVIGSIAVAAHFSFGPFWFALAFVAPLAHMFTQLKGAYALTRFGAAWRTVALSFGALITLSLYALLMIVLGVLD